MTDHPGQSIDDRLAHLRIRLGPPIPPIGSYHGVVVDGGVVYTSGVVGLLAPDWTLLHPGRVGEDLTVEEAREGARAAMISTLANLRGELGELTRIRRFLKVTGYVQSAPTVTGLPSVLNGATDLLTEIFGPELLPARTAVGVYALPGGASVELDCVVALNS